MSQDFDQNAFFTTADKFINLANELTQQDKSQGVGSALRYAAARYSAFEASLHVTDLAAEKEAVKAAILKDYEAMLDENIDAYIRHIEAQKANQ